MSSAILNGVAKGLLIYVCKTGILADCSMDDKVVYRYRINEYKLTGIC